MSIFKRKQKEEKEMKQNKFAGKRQYSIRAGLPEKTLKRLNDLYELLHCDPDPQGYVVTTFKEMNELTEMDVNLMTIMIHNGMIRKSVTGGSPKFKYKWDTIKPTMDMAVKLIDKRLDLKKGPAEPESVVSESQPESVVEEKTDEVENQEIIDEMNLTVRDKPDEVGSSIIIDSRIAGDVMTMHVNLKKLGITETDVLNAVLAINSTK